jgi:hypothetical protein
LAHCAANIVMQIIYEARFGRMEHFRKFGFLACEFTRWTSTCDRRLYRLVSYCGTVVNGVQFARVGNPLGELQPCLHSDAYLAACTLTQRSTTGVYMIVRGKRSCRPTVGFSQRQTCVSTSTLEAEMLATHHAFRTVGVPGLELWRSLLPNGPKT